MQNKPHFLDLFCGIGGLSLGLQHAGLCPVGGIDLWGDALDTFRHNHAGAKCLEADISRVSVARICSEFGTTVSEIDVIAGGPPCQGFSTVGKRDSADPRNVLWQSFHQLVSEIRPAYVVIENVEGLNVMEKGGVRDRIVEQFGDIGYRMKADLLRAADYGVPQPLQPKSGFHNSYARLASWKPAIAVTSNMRKPSSARATHPQQNRGLTVREGLRLQSFDDDFVVLGSRTSQYLQVGNAVPPLLGLAIGLEVMKAFASNTREVLSAARARRTTVKARKSKQPLLWEA